MYFLAGIGLVILLSITLLVLIVMHYFRKGIKTMRRMMSGELTEEEFLRMSNKHYRDSGIHFNDDYFRGSAGTSNADSTAGRAAGGQSSSTSSGGQRSTGGRRTSASSSDGEQVIIYDNRDPRHTHHHIFDDDEGEYVSYTEE